MRKIYSFLLLFAATATGAMAQKTYTYEVKDVSQNDWSWPAGTNAATAGDSKDVVIRHHVSKTFFVGATATELKVDNDVTGKQYKFRFIQTGTTNRYKIYAVDAQKFVKWKTDGKQASITALVDEGDANDWLVVNDNGAASFNGAFDIIAGTGTYSNGATCWNAHEGLADNRVIGGWNANDGNSSWEICKENDAVTLTYNLKYNGVKKSTVTLPATIGGNYPACELPANCTATFPAGTVSATGTHEYDVNVTLGNDYPFVPVASFAQNGNWYAVTLRGKYIYYDGASHELKVGTNTPPTTYTDQYLFQFQGNPFEGYKFLNRAAGSGKVAGSASVADNVVLKMVAESDATARIYQLSNNSGFHFKESNTNNGYINDNGGVSYWVSSWSQNDPGGSFTFTKIDLSDHLISYRASKEELNTLLSNTSVQALFATTAVSDVRNEMSTYNPENSIAGNTAGLSKVQEWYKKLYESVNAQVLLKSPTRGGKYAYIDLEGSTLLQVEKDEDAVFLVKGSAEGLTFTHATSARKLGNTGGPSSVVPTYPDGTTSQGVFKFKICDNSTSEVAFVCAHPGHTQYNALHADSYDKVVAWEAVNVGGSTWKVEKTTYSDAELLAAARKRLESAESVVNLGTRLGQYTAANQADYQVAKTTNEIAVIEKGVTSVLNATLNMPKAGQFLRIKSTMNGEKYVSSTPVSNRLSLVATADAATLFYFDGTKLVSVAEGKFVGLKNNFAFAEDYGAAGQPIEFHESTNASDPSLYRINIGNRAFYANATSPKTDAAGKNTDNAAGYRFKLEEVTELPIEVGETGYATFFTPVAATLSGGTAYKAKVKGENLSLTSIDGTIPANTAFVLRATANTTVNLQLSATAAAALTDNDLTGAVTTAAAPISATDNVYALVKNASGEAVFGKLAAGLRKRAFRAFVTTASGSAQALDFSFGHVTGIETLNTGAAHAPIYDLSGRRVLTPAQGGVYLQNGKKFIQK
ncbi:MAG: hypothetical protein ACFNP8_02990 [Alloprevotella sp.]